MKAGFDPILSISEAEMIGRKMQFALISRKAEMNGKDNCKGKEHSISVGNHEVDPFFHALLQLCGRERTDRYF